MTSLDIHSIDRGIVFLMARWSGSSFWAHRELTSFLTRRGIAVEELIALDIDLYPQLYELPEFSGKIHGWGEAAVIRNGNVVFFAALGKDQSKVLSLCEELLQAYEG